MFYSNTVIQPNINTNLTEMERIERKRLMGISELPDPNTPYTIKASAYIRVSTRPQGEDDKASLPNQLKATSETIKHNGWVQINTYQDIQRTSFEENPYERSGLSKALDDAKKGLFDVLVVWVDSRLGRNQEETQAIRKMFRMLGVQTYSVLKPLPIIDPRFYSSKLDKFRMWQEGVNDLSSAAESAEFAEKMQFGKMKVAMNGKMPSRVPYGYFREKKIVDNKVVSEIKVNEQQLEVVKEVFGYYLDKGFGIRKICGILNARKVLGPKNGLWNYSTIRYLLKNPAYAGKVRWGWKLSEFRKSKQRLSKGHNGVIVNGQHRAVISEEDFIRVQKKTEQRAMLGGRAVASHGLLVGILKCPRCGSGAYVTSAPSMYAYKMEKLGRPKEGFSKIHFYVCSKVSKYGSTACTRYICGQLRVEQLVIDEVRNLANSPEAQKSFEKTLKETKDRGVAIKDKIIKQELAKIPKIRDRYSKALGLKFMSYEEYGKQMGQLNEREKELTNQAKELQLERQENEKIKEKISKAINIFKNFGKIWEKAPVEVKKDLLRSIIRKIVYDKKKLKIEYQI